MTPERRAQIIEEVFGIRRKLKTLADAFKAAVDFDWRKAAAEEFARFLKHDHGRRLPKAERDRIQHEIAAEHRARYREQCEEWYSHRQLAHADEQPRLDAFLAECQRCPTVDEEFVRRHPTDGRDMGAMLMTGLLEITARKDLRATVAGRTPSENLARWDYLQTANGEGPPQQIVLDTIEARLIEEHKGKWTFDPEDRVQATAARALDQAIEEACQKRIPTELAEALAEVKAADSFAATRQQALRLRLLSPKELEEAVKRAEGEGEEEGSE